jgi:SUN family beta-glucosidase
MTNLHEKPSAVVRPAIMAEHASPAPAPPAPKPARISAAVQTVNYDASDADISKPFPDGVLDCNTIPQGYGLKNADWLGGNGWLSQQVVELDGNGVIQNNIRTESGCGGQGPLSYCQYYCSGNAVDIQWPVDSQQPRSGATVGGLKCMNGKLFRADTSKPTLCVPSSNLLTVTVRNTLNQDVPICNTAYPGKFINVYPRFTIN